VPPRKKTAAAGPPKLTHDDIAALKPRVQAGETPRVVVRAASAAVPAGTRGNIVRIGNPSEGEYVVVRLGRDEVPFAPSELGMTARTAAAGAPPAGRKAAAAKASAPPKKAAPARTPAKAAANTATEAPAKATPAPAKATGAAAKSPTKAVKAPAKRTGKTTGGRSRRALPALVVTLRFNDGGWTVEASRGARRLARSSPVRPGAVKAFADLVDEPTVAEAITETIESCRSVVEERAASLRAELIAAEAALKEYESRRR
jgi:hypothetical protein